MAQWIKEWGKAANSEDLNSIPRVHLLDERTNFWKLSSGFPMEWHTCAKNTHTQLTKVLKPTVLQRCLI